MLYEKDRLIVALIAAAHVRCKAYEIPAMNTNVGVIDRIIRIALGLVLLSLPFALGSPMRWVGITGLIPLFTGLLRFCPLYSVFGFNTCHGMKSR